MKRRIGYLFFILFVLIALIVINFQIVSSRLVSKERVEAMLYDLLAHPAKVGKVHFSLFSGIEIDDLQVSDNNQQELFRISKIKISYDKAALIQGKLVLNTIEIIQPQANINEDFLTLWKRQPLKITNLPAISIRQGKIYISNKALLRPDYRFLLKDVNVNLYPFAGTRYRIEGTADADSFGKWLISGDFDAANNQLDSTFWTSELELDNTITEKIAPPLRPAWLKYQPVGLVTLGVHLNGQLDNGGASHFTVLLESLDTSVIYGKFPYRVSHIKGKIEVSENGIRLENLSGTNGATRVSLEGIVSDFTESAGFSLKISADGLNIDNQLFEAVPVTVKEVWNNLRPGGTTNIAALITRDVGKDKVEFYQIKITCRDCTATTKYFPFPVTDINGEVEYTNEKTLLKSLTARRNKSQLAVTGTVWETADRKNTFDLTIKGKEIELSDYALRDALKEVIKGSETIWENYQPEKTVDVTVNLKNTTGQPRVYNLKTQIDCRGNKIKYGDEQYALSNIQGQLEYEKEENKSVGRLKFSHLSAENEQTKFEITGDFPEISAIISPTAPAPYSLNLKVTNLAITPFSKGILPPEIVNFCRPLDFSGNIDLSLDINQSYRKDGSFKLKTEYTMDANITGGSLNPGILLSEINGKITNHGEISERRNSSYGSISLSQIKIAGKRFENISAKFTQENNRLTIPNITGNGYQGSVNGFFNVFLPDYAYSGQIIFNGLELKDFIQDTFLQGKEISGKATLKLNDISGTGKDLKSWQGDGEFAISEGHLWDVPILLSIFTSFKFNQKSVFQTGLLKFRISKEKIEVYSAKFSSPEIMLRGKGTIGFDSNLDFQFDVKSSTKDIIPIEIAKFLITLFTEPLYTIKVEGPFTAPIGTIKALPTLDFSSSDK